MCIYNICFFSYIGINKTMFTIMPAQTFFSDSEANSFALTLNTYKHLGTRCREIDIRGTFKIPYLVKNKS